MFFNKKFFMVSLSALFMAAGVSMAHSANGPVNSVTPAIVGGGGNLTSFSGNVGALNNNAWNTMMNSGKGNAGPAADFGNCNSVILRCAQPKCASGGCTSLDVAASIVNGCVQSNATCKQYGDDLVNYISAQLVASSTAKANEQAIIAQQQAAAQSNQQNEYQMQQMQAQMQQMQAQMLQSQEESAARVEAALAEQQRMAAVAAQSAALAPTAAAQPAADITAAIDRGVSAEILARNQASGAIMTKLEDVSASLKSVKAAMQNTFDYAGCDRNGRNCQKVPRVKKFKTLAEGFFDPFEEVQDQVYDALIQAQALGVDITDIYMMLNGSCNVWGQYLCTGQGGVRKCTQANINPGEWGCGAGMLGKVAPQQDSCQLIKMLTSSDEVQQNWLNVQEVGEGARKQSIEVACASDALDNSKFFANRRKKIEDVGIDELAMVLSADAYVSVNKDRITIENPCYDPKKTTEAELRKIISGARYATSTTGGTSETIVLSSGAFGAVPEVYTSEQRAATISDWQSSTAKAVTDMQARMKKECDAKDRNKWAWNGYRCEELEAE